MACERPTKVAGNEIEAVGVAYVSTAFDLLKCGGQIDSLREWKEKQEVIYGRPAK